MAKGNGHLYLRGSTWWMKYYVAGRPVYESTGKTNEQKAGRVLRDRLVRLDRGEPLITRLDRVAYAEAAKDLREHYASSGARDPEEASWRLAHLEAFFGHYRLATIGPADVTRYTTRRQGEERRTGPSTGSWPCSAAC